MINVAWYCRKKEEKGKLLILGWRRKVIRIHVVKPSNISKMKYQEQNNMIGKELVRYLPNTVGKIIDTPRR